MICVYRRIEDYSQLGFQPKRERERKREMKRLNWVGFGSQGLPVDYVGGVGRRRFSWQGSGEIDLVVVVDLGSESGERLGRN